MGAHHPVDFLLAGKEQKNIPREGPVDVDVHDRIHSPFQVIRRRLRRLKRVRERHRVHPARHVEDRAVEEIRAELVAIKGRGGDDELERVEAGSDLNGRDEKCSKQSAIHPMP